MKKQKNIWLFAGMSVGIVAIIIGLVFLFSFQDAVFYGNINSASGGISRLGTAKFGGDFYTEIYEATAFAGNAAAGIYEMLGTCFGVFFILIGAIDICAFGSMLLPKNAVAAKPEAYESPEIYNEPLSTSQKNSGTTYGTTVNGFTSGAMNIPKRKHSGMEEK